MDALLTEWELRRENYVAIWRADPLCDRGIRSHAKASALTQAIGELRDVLGATR